MPAFGRDGILEPTHIADAVSHVRVISRQEKPSVSSARGAALFEVHCAACNAPAGERAREVGVPTLPDVTWLYAGPSDSLLETVSRPRICVVTSWNGRLVSVPLIMLVASCFSTGGGGKAA